MSQAYIEHELRLRSDNGVLVANTGVVTTIPLGGPNGVATYNSLGNAITLTTTGTSGAATIVSNTLNIPNYTGALSGYVPYTGATQAVDLGAYNLTVNNVKVGRGISTNTSNIAIGNSNTMGVFTATGGSNLAIGNTTLPYLTSGYENVAIGASALIALTTGYYNTALGNSAGSGIQSGVNNAFIGRYAGGNILVGSYNTIVGSWLGNSTTSNNVVLSDGNGNLRYRFDGTNNNFYQNVNFASTLGNGTYTYTLPSATGTLALVGDLSAYVPTSRTLTINGTTYDLSANRSWTIPAGVTSFNTRTGDITLLGTDVTGALGYTPEDVANKSTSTSLGTSNTLYPTQNAVKTYVDSAVAGGIILQGDWNASTNSPNISGTTTTGWAWRVSVDGSTNLGGITDWKVGDLAVKSATGWLKIDNTDSVTGTGTLNYLTKITGVGSALTIGNSSISDDGTLVLISSPNTTINSVTNIGSTSGFPQLTVNSVGTTQLRILAYSSSYNSELQFCISGISPFGRLQYDNSSNYLTTFTNSTAYTRLFSNGNFAIGTTLANNGFKLEVEGTTKIIGQLTLGSTITNGLYTYTLPGATGTIALTSDIPVITGYVPYTGATSNVNLGNYTFSSNNIFLTGDSGGTMGSYLGFKQYSSSSSTKSGYTGISALNNTTLQLAFDTGSSTNKIVFLDNSNIPSNSFVTLYFPSSSGTLALLSDIPSISGYVPYTGATNNVNLGYYKITASTVEVSTSSAGYSNSLVLKTGTTNGVYGTNGISLQSSFGTADTLSIYFSAGASLKQVDLSALLLSAPRAYVLPDASGTLTLSNGNANYVPKFTGTNSIGNSLIYDNGSGIGINTTSPYASSSFKLDVNGGVIIKNTSGTTAQLVLINADPSGGGNNGFVQMTASGTSTGAYGALQTYYGTSIIGGALRLQPNSGSVLINKTTDSGYALQVTGAIQQSSVTASIVKADSSGLLTAAVAGADYLAPSALSGYVPTSRTLTINGLTYDLSADRSWTITAGVSSVFGRTGIVTAQEGDYSLTQLSDVTLTSPTTGQVLKYNGSGWINSSDSGLTSVGVSMPSAFSVSNSPLTSNGTISITGAGTVTQYIRGDGSLANFSTSGGGGSSVSYYLNGSVNQGTFGGNTYYEMNKSPILGAGTNFTINANGYIAQFITDANDPSLLEIPGGNWNFEMHFSASSGGGTPSFYVELYKYNGTTFTLIASNSTTPEGITNGTANDLYITSLAVPTTSLTITDRLAVRVYVTHSGRTITLYTEDNNLCQVVTTFSTGITALNGLTAQVQYFATGTSGSDFNISSVTATHTFNLPTASASNRGALSTTDWTNFQNAYNLRIVTTNTPLSFVSNTLSIQQANSTQSGYLSSTDWNTFNNKQNALNGTGFVKISGTTITYDNSTYYLASNPNSYIPLTALSSTATGLTYTNTTGVFSLTSGYVIPTTTSTGNWDTAYTNRITSATSPLSISSNVISISQATTSTNGYLSSTDWNTFNNKQNALTNPITGTGASGQVAYWNGTTTQTGTNNFYWDNTNVQLGIGTNTPSAGVTSYSTTAATQFKSAGTAPAMTFSNTLTSPTLAAVFGLATGTGQFITGTAAGDFAIANQSATAGAIVFGTGTTEKMRMTSAGTFSIGNTNSTYNLDVTGTGRFTTSVILAGTSGTASIGITPQTDKLFIYNASGTNTGLTIQQDGTGDILRVNGNSGANRLVVQQGGNVGIGTSSPSSKLQLSGTDNTASSSSTFWNFTFIGQEITNLSNTANTVSGLAFVGGSSRAAVSAIGGVLESTSLEALAFYTGGSGVAGGSVPERMRITSAGNVGIGTTTFPLNSTNRGYLAVNGTDSIFELQNSGSTAAYLFANTGNIELAASGSRFTMFSTNGAERMRITSAGNIGIGTTSPLQTATNRTVLNVNGTSTSLINLSVGGTLGAYWYYGGSSSQLYSVGQLDFNTSNATGFTFNPNGAEAMRITSSGDVGIGTSSSPYTVVNRKILSLNGGSNGALFGLKVNDVNDAYFYSDGANTYINRTSNSGNIYVTAGNAGGGVYLAYTATSWTANSDERLKNINSNIENALSKLLTLRAVNFSWKSDETNKENLGLIAQDVEKVFPQIIDKGKLPSKPNQEQIDETEYLGVRYTELIPVLVKAIQEQQKQIEELKSLINK